MSKIRLYRQNTKGDLARALVGSEQVIDMLMNIIERALREGSHTPAWFHNPEDENQQKELVDWLLSKAQAHQRFCRDAIVKLRGQNSLWRRLLEYEAAHGNKGFQAWVADVMTDGRQARDDKAE